MAIHSSLLAWRIPWTEEPGGLQSMGSQSQMTEQRSLTQAPRLKPLIDIGPRTSHLLSFLCPNGPHLQNEELGPTPSQLLTAPPYRSPRGFLQH